MMKNITETADWPVRPRGSRRPPATPKGDAVYGHRYGASGSCTVWGDREWIFPRSSVFRPHTLDATPIGCFVFWDCSVFLLQEFCYGS